MYVALTENYLYASRIGFRRAPPFVRKAYGDVVSVRLGTGTRAATLLIELPDTTLEIVGVMHDELARFESVLAAKRPASVQPGMAATLDEMFDD